MSTVTSLSFTFVNTYASQPAKASPAAERPAQAERAEKHCCGEHRPAPRQNRLVEAMMSALRELGFGSQAAAGGAEATTGSTPVAVPAQGVVTTDAANANTTSTAATIASTSVAATPTDSGGTEAATEAATETAAQPAVTLESAVQQFAHELFSALRQMGRGDASGSEQGSRRIDGEGGRRHHHHGHHGWRREGYGDMAQRLNALSQTFAAPAAVAAAGAAPVSTSISITLTIQNGVAQTPAQVETTNAATTAADVVAEVPAEAAQAAEAVEAEPATPLAAAETSAQEVARNPLLDAFSQLFGLLKPQAAQTDMAEKLRSFLQTLAQAMRPDSMSGTQAQPVGGLVNITA